MARARALFFGTPAIAVPSLVALAEVCEVVAVVCQPDRPAGRDLSLRPPEVKLAAERLGLPVHQPLKVRTDEFSRWVADQRAELAVVLAYGRILTPAVLAGPRLGCVNLHASLLPAYRGAAPINWAIVRGEVETGVCLMQMDEGLDTGPVYVRRRLAIGPDETAGELFVRMGELAAETVRDEVPRLLAGELRAEPQDHARATHAPPLTREHGLVDWSQPAARVHDLARGLHPWPGAHSPLKGKSFKLLQTARTSEAPEPGAPPGSVHLVGKKRVLVACGEGFVEIVRGQLEGRKALSAVDLIGGRTFSPGDRFG
ncbi:MAG TPA: methionyl-tRNA formyltransferase [Polyangiaceae bacterium]|nr:methionyl-tRNA formyltransferase [Polyangiaceae bacterium]